MSRLGYHSCRTSALLAESSALPVSYLDWHAARLLLLGIDSDWLVIHLGRRGGREHLGGAHFVTVKQALREVGVPTLRGVARRQRDKLTPGAWLAGSVITALSSSPGEKSYFLPQSVDNHTSDKGPTPRGGIKGTPGVTYLFDRLDAGCSVTETY